MSNNSQNSSQTLQNNSRTDPLFVVFLEENGLLEKLENLKTDFKNGKIGREFLIEKISKIVIASKLSDELQNQIQEIQNEKSKLKNNSQNTKIDQNSTFQNPLLISNSTQNSKSEKSEIRQKIEKIAQINQNSNPNKTIIIGNGDILNLTDAFDKVQKFGVDGVMIGRGIFANPWLFGGIEASVKTPCERVNLFIFHLNLWQKTWENGKNYQSLKKYFKIYIQGFHGAVELRIKLMETTSIEKAVEICQEYAATL